MKLFRSVTSRLVFFYFLLLALLGGAFMLYTVLSFRHYTNDTVTRGLFARSQEIWNNAQSYLDDTARLAQVMTTRFAPEAQDRFIRIRQGSHILYRSGDPTDHSFSASDVPLLAPDDPARLLGNLLLSTRVFSAP